MNDGQPGDRRYLLWLWKPSGYELREVEGDLPAIGSEVTEGELRLRVFKVGPSPLPGDQRPCVYTNAAR
jgi:hypothetical protein